MRKQAFLALALFIAASSQTEAKQAEPFDELREIYLDDPVLGEASTMMRVFAKSPCDDPLEFKMALTDYENKMRKLRREMVCASAPEDEQILQQMEAFEKDPVAKLRAFFTFDQLVKGVQVVNVEYLESYNDMQSMFDSSFLSNPRLVDKLKLSKHQIKELKERHSQIMKVQNELWDQFGAAYDRIADSAMDDIRRVLDKEQLDQFDDLVGTPINWSRMICETNSTFDFSFKVHEKTDEVFYLNAGEPTDDMQAIDYHLFVLLQQNFILEELELTPVQKEKLGAAVNDFKKNWIRTNEGSEKRFDDLLDGKSSYPDDVANLLIRHQEETLRQLELQFRTGGFRFSFGLLHPAMIDKLNLSSGQQTELRKVAKRFKRDVYRFSNEARTQIGELLRNEYLETLTLLDRDQLARYSLLTGWDANGFQTR